VTLASPNLPNRTLDIFVHHLSPLLSISALYSGHFRLQAKSFLQYRKVTSSKSCTKETFIPWYAVCYGDLL